MRVRLRRCGVRADLEPRRRHQLRDARDRPPAARVRSRQARGRRSSRAPRARAARRITTLDGVERTLQESDVVIGDASGPIALAGVMGGADSEVSATTTRVLLESATFEPRACAAPPSGSACTPRRRTASSAASTPNGVPHAARARRPLLARLGGGARRGRGRSIATRSQREPRRVDAVGRRACTRLAGFEIPLEQAARAAAPRRIADATPRRRRRARRRPSRRSGPTSRARRISSRRSCACIGYDACPARLPRWQRARPTPSPEALRRSRARRARGARPARGVTLGLRAARVLRRSGCGADGARDGDRRVKNPISRD